MQLCTYHCKQVLRCLQKDPRKGSVKHLQPYPQNGLPSSDKYTSAKCLKSVCEIGAITRPPDAAAGDHGFASDEKSSAVPAGCYRW